MSLLSDLNDKIKRLSTRVAEEFKTQQSAIDSKVSTVNGIAPDAAGNVSVNGARTDYSSLVEGSTPFTAPADGVCFVHFKSVEGYHNILVNGVFIQAVGGSYNNQDIVTVPVSEGDSLTTNLGAPSVKFFPYK